MVFNGIINYLHHDFLQYLGLTLVAARNPVFFQSKTFFTWHIGVSNERHFGATSFGQGIMGDYEGASRGRQKQCEMFFGSIGYVYGAATFFFFSLIGCRV